MGIGQRNVSLLAAANVTEKIVKRGEAQMKIKDLFDHHTTPFSISTYFKQLSTAVANGGVCHDRGELPLSEKELIKHTWDDGEEIVASPIDTYAAHILHVTKRDIPSKTMMGAESVKNTTKAKTIFNFDDDDMFSHTTSKYKRTVSISRGQSQANTKRGAKTVTEEQDVRQVPLKRDHDEDDIPEIEVYRKQKQRDFDRKEEERKKQEKLKRRIGEVSKEQRAQEEELNKKQYTYDTKGDIIFVKNLNTDGLSKEVNYELKYNLKKMPVTTKGIYSFQKMSKDKMFGKKKSSVGALDEVDSQGEKKQKKMVDIYALLKSGKDLKKAFSGVKPIQNLIVPMGSNYDQIQPDSGVMVEEKGRQKRGAINSSIQAGKYSMQDYNAKFSRTSIQFSQTMNATNPNMTVSQNSMLGADLYKQRVQKVAEEITIKPQRMNSVPALIIDQSSLEGNTLQLSQPMYEASLLNQSRSTIYHHHSRDKINVKSTKYNPNMLLSPVNHQDHLMRTFSFNESLSFNQTQKSFLPQFHSDKPFMNKSRSSLHLHQKHVPAIQEEESLLLPPLQNQLEEFNKVIARNNGQALIEGSNMTSGKQKQTRKPNQINQSVRNVNMSNTMYGGYGNSDSTQSLLKSMKHQQQHRVRPYIEKISSHNKNHLPPPPIGKSLGHGLKQNQ